MGQAAENEPLPQGSLEDTQYLQHGFHLPLTGGTYGCSGDTTSEPGISYLGLNPAE